MSIYYTLFYINTSLIAALGILKTILFFSKTRFRSLMQWVYFDKYSIYTSRGIKVVKAKRTQNALSFIIMILVVLDLLFLILMKLG
jgi:hypothetical protein